MVVTTDVCGSGAYQRKLVTVGPECHDPGCRGYGVTDKGIMFIGIAPVKEEMKTGRPLTGSSGQMLDAVMKAVGLQRSDTYCTNLMCWYKDVPTKEEADKCSARLDQEIFDIKPKIIVLLGSVVTEIFTGRKFGKTRGAVQWSDKYNCYVMSTYHPAAILRGLGERGSTKDDKASVMIYDFVRDLKKINKVLQWEPNAKLAQIDYTVVTTPEHAQEVLNSFSKDELVALDVETTYAKDDEEVEIFEDEILCVGVGNTNHAWVFTPTALYKDDNKTPALEWPDLKWVMHNAIFDTQVMHHYFGVWINVHEDTMLQSYSLDERSGLHRLKTLAREYLSAGFYEDDRFYGKLKLDEIPRELLYEYNAKDVVYTARLCEMFIPEQIEDNVRDIYQRIMIPCVNMFKEVQYRGVAIDSKLHAKLAWNWGHKFLADEEELQDMAEQLGYQGRINLSSPQQLRTLLFGILSLPILKRTPKGEPSTDKEVLEALQGQHEFVDKLLDFRHLSHMFNLYIVNLQNNLKTDGRAHAVVKLHSSRTGRPSYTDPPLQTIPRKSEKFEETYSLLRNMFETSSIEWVRTFNQLEGLPVPDLNDEMIMIEADYGKAELWTAACVSNDHQMYEDLKSGDYHTRVAASIKDKPIEEVNKDDRDDSKRVSFGVLYDREAPSLAKALKISVPQAQSYINGFHTRNASYSSWFKNTQNRVRTEGELVTITGRKRRLIVIGSAVRVLKQAVNFPIQSTANDVLLDSAVEIHPKLRALGGHILFTVHDSIVSEVPKSKLLEAIKIIHDAMTAERFPGMVRLPVEIKVGKNWGQNKELHDCAVSVEKQKDNIYGIEKWGRCLY